MTTTATPLLTAALDHGWEKIPGRTEGLTHISDGRMLYGDAAITLYSLANDQLPEEEFNYLNEQFEKHGITRIGSETPVMDRLVRYEILLRKEAEAQGNPVRSVILSGKEYFLALMDAAESHFSKKGSEAYNVFTGGGLADATRNIHRSRGRTDNGKIISLHLEYDTETGELAGDGPQLTLPGEEGWIEVVDERGLPIALHPKKKKEPVGTSKSALQGKLFGYWYPGEFPEGEDFIDVRDPAWGDEGPLDAHADVGRSSPARAVAALRARYARPADYQAELEEVRTEASKARVELESAIGNAKLAAE